MPEHDISELEKNIGYEFKDKTLLLEALTHKSFQHENPRSAPHHNERLEFLGDSVLGMVVVDYLFNSRDRYTESMMSKIKSYIVKSKVLSEIAKGISLGNYLRLGKGEEETGGRNKVSILSDAMEALVGAVYIDGGYEKSKSLVLRLFKEKIDAAIKSRDFHDYKSELQEESQMRFGVLPEYRLVKEEGQEHKKVFTVEVFIAGERYGQGRGRSKKEAQTLAAKEALKNLSV
jgi:ribonuclease-3